MSARLRIPSNFGDIHERRIPPVVVHVISDTDGEWCCGKAGSWRLGRKLRSFFFCVQSPKAASHPPPANPKCCEVYGCITLSNFSGRMSTTASPGSV